MRAEGRHGGRGGGVVPQDVGCPLATEGVLLPVVSHSAADDHTAGGVEQMQVAVVVGGAVKDGVVPAAVPVAGARIWRAAQRATGGQ